MEMHTSVDLTVMPDGQRGIVGRRAAQSQLVLLSVPLNIKKWCMVHTVNPCFPASMVPLRSP
jgi:hypothetical protein